VARSMKKGPFVDGHLIKKVIRCQREWGQKSDQNLVASLDDPSRNDRPDLGRSQRA
jgi:hypothetical protein